MPKYSKESLAILRQKVDLVEVLQGHLQLKKAGGAYKALCPFHDERTPSFVVQRGDTHYHCFGCGAHGDAIQFLMQHLRISFTDAVSSLAERFSVHLEEEDKHVAQTAQNRLRLKEVIASAHRFFHHYLLNAQEGLPYVRYMTQRGFSLEFIRAFQLGLAPSREGLLPAFLRNLHFSEEEMIEAGLLVQRGGRVREFFQERIMFPIHDATGSCIGFSARKIREDVYGGKYINSQETLLFKKSRHLFGLNYSRKRIAKERHVIIVEGQLDALRLIYHGFDYTVAALGTAFGESHVQELVRLGIVKVYLLFDGDKAGRAAAVKAGQLFQKAGVEVFIATMPQGCDPDSLVAKQGPIAIVQELYASKEYLPFFIDELSKTFDAHSPVGKQKIVDEVRQRIGEWGNQIMAHESLKKAARILNLPEDLVALEKTTSSPIKAPSSRALVRVNPTLILEADLLRWILLCKNSMPELLSIVHKNISEEDFVDQAAKNLYRYLVACIKENTSCDLIEFTVEQLTDEMSQLVSLILHKKVQMEKAHEQCITTMQKLKERNWMYKREEIKVQIHSGMCSEAEVLELARQFDFLKKNPPKVVV